MSSKVNPVVYQTANVIGVVGALVVNMLANALPLNGVTTGQVSDSYPNLFTPPGYVFSIWGVIYALAVVFMVYQARTSQRSEAYLVQIGFLYLVGAVANVSWLFIFHYSYGVPQLFVVSLVPMAVLLLCLLCIYQRLDIGRREVPRTQKLVVHLPISVYLGWISLAIIANIASVLNVLFPSIPEPTQALWTAFVVVVAFVISALVVLTRRDFAFGLVVVWASVGIAFHRVVVPVIFATSIASALILVILIVVAPFAKKASIVEYYMVRSSR